jgi:hypothetical protein
LLGIEFDLFVQQYGAEASSSLATRFLGAGAGAEQLLYARNLIGESGVSTHTSQVP